MTSVYIAKYVPNGIGCNQEGNRIAKHFWNEWSYQSSSKCDQYRDCQRCNITDTDHRVKHLWDVWKYKSPTSCVNVRFCRRCADGEEEKNPKTSDHHWGKPEKISCNSAMITCLRCKAKDEIKLSPPEHDWGVWKAGENNFSRNCISCEETEFHY